MATERRSNFERLRVYRRAEELADQVREIVIGWDAFARNTVGAQLVRAADSIGANIAEGEGRGSYADNRRSVRMARGSLNETKHFLRRAFKRRLLTPAQTGKLKPVVELLGPTLNAYLKSIGTVQRARTEDAETSGSH